MTDAKAGPTPRTDALIADINANWSSGQGWARIELLARQLERELAAATLRADTAALTLKNICDEWNEDCDPECDSYGHTETCKATNIAAAKRALRERAESAESRLSARATVER